MKALVLPNIVLYMHICTIFYTCKTIHLQKISFITCTQPHSPRGLSGASSLLQLLIGSGGEGGDGPPLFVHPPPPPSDDWQVQWPALSTPIKHPPPPPPFTEGGGRRGVGDVEKWKWSKLDRFLLFFNGSWPASVSMLYWFNVGSAVSLYE